MSADLNALNRTMKEIAKELHYQNKILATLNDNVVEIVKRLPPKEETDASTS